MSNCLLFATCTPKNERICNDILVVCPERRSRLDWKLNTTLHQKVSALAVKPLLHNVYVTVKYTMCNFACRKQNTVEEKDVKVWYYIVWYLKGTSALWSQCRGALNLQLHLIANRLFWFKKEVWFYSNVKENDPFTPSINVLSRSRFFVQIRHVV